MRDRERECAAGGDVGALPTGDFDVHECVAVFVVSVHGEGGDVARRANYARGFGGAVGLGLLADPEFAVIGVDGLEMDRGGGVDGDEGEGIRHLSSLGDAWCRGFAGRGIPRATAEKAPSVRAVKEYCIFDDER